MRVTVTQLSAVDLDETWSALVTHTHESLSDFVLLPEMSFSTWLAVTRDVDAAAWVGAVEEHTRWIERLGELGVDTVAGTRPIVADGRRYNESFLWTPASGAVGGHKKTYLPDETGFWEATWYDRGPSSFDAIDGPDGPIGFQICTEMWFLEHSRGYGEQGVGMLLTPRATPTPTLQKWIAGGRAAAVCSGAFGLSSNHTGSYGDLTMAGGGWVMSPDGEVLAITGADNPFATVTIDLAVARIAKGTFPRYIDATPLDGDLSPG